jgi:ATP-dependent exoDNAse (exonuclease V) beta subunit
MGVAGFKGISAKNEPATGAEALRRTFIGWDEPVIPHTVDQLFSRYVVDRQWDMRTLTVVLPGGLAKRRLQELLALRAQAEGKTLYPPQIVTVGQLPEYLFVAKFPFATDLVQNLAWVAALQKTDAEKLKWIVPQPPAAAATEQWLELGKMLSSVHRELASDQLDFKTVADHLGKHPEADRWHALADVQHHYLAELDGLDLWDIQTARLVALKLGEPKTDRNILVVGAVDLNKTQRGFLQAVADHVEVWIAAPESYADWFDPFGCLISDRWQEAMLELDEHQLLVGNTPTDVAELTAGCLAELGQRFHTRDLTIGIPDRTIVPTLQHQLSICNVTARNGAGSPLAQSEPAALLAYIGKFVQQRNFATFAALVRQPAIQNVLGSLKAELPPNWLSIFDSYCQEVLPKAIDDYVNEKVDGAHVYHIVTQAIVKWLSKLGTRSQPLSVWVQPLLQVMKTAYVNQLCDLDNPEEGPLFNASQQICNLIVGLRDIPAKLEPRMTAGELIDWLMSNMAGKLVPEPSNESSIEMLGWLELPLDDAPALIIAGIHDGVVPESVNSDAFLPNQLRRQLGMMDNARRFARDMYSLQVIKHARRHLRIVVGKSDHSGDPLVPSRLLMACKLQDLPSRVLRLVSEESVDILPPVEGKWQPVEGVSRLVVPKPANVEPPRSISVTAFRDYLQCPYRYYLRHVLKLREEGEVDAELDAPKFGILLHDTLALLDGHPVGASSIPEEVEEFLVSNLHTIAQQKFGPNPPAGVLIQIEQAELRLRAFAPRQAEHAAAGWRIRFVEQGIEFKDNVRIGVGPQSMTLIGRIDRIDYHPEKKQWAIWDYKTSDNAKDPVKVHWTKADGWKDLQLTLYRKIAAKLGVTGEPQIGYIAIPKQGRDTGFVPAPFTAEQLAEADQLASDVVGKIRNGEFWPEKLEALPYDDFARICQTDIQHVAVAAPLRVPTRQQDQAGLRTSPGIATAVLGKAQEMLQLQSMPKSKVQFDPLLIRASAGTGKTFQLSNRLLQIVLSGQEVDHVLATTFTRKAAGEIMHRVLQRLAKACLEDKDNKTLAEHVLEVDTSAPACLAALRRLTVQIHRFRVSTLDSFFAQIARTFSLEMMLPPGWSALDPVQEPIAQMQAIQEMLDSHDRKTLVNLVRMLAKGDSQRQVADQVLSTVRAGYGAFRVTDREAWDQLPLPTPPSESAMANAVQTLELTAMNHKSVDREFAKLLGLFRLGDWEAVIAHGAHANLDAITPTYYGKELPPEICQALTVLRKKAASELLPIRRNQTLASYDVLQAYNERYSALAKRQRTLAFSDVSYLLSKWMLPKLSGHSTDPGRGVDPRQLQLRLDCGVNHLLLDEFQDTSPEQWQILEPLAAPLAGGSHQDRSFFCVGDTKQAIYGWRGGVAEIFDSVTNSVKGIQQAELSTSFRSSPEVIAVVNEVFSNLNRHEKFADCNQVARAWSSHFPEHRTARNDLAGYVRLQNGPAVDSDLNVDERRQLMMSFSADQIAELTKQTDASVGVLFRRNADVASMIAMLRDRGISASQDGGNPLTDSAAVGLVLSLVHLADHPGDGICAFHVASSPLASKLPNDVRGEPAKMAAWFRQKVARLGIGRTIEIVADWLANDLSWWDQHRLKQLVHSAFEFQASGGGRLTEFERSVMEQRISLPSESQVKVMTIHKSKGLEFDAVFLPDLAIDLASNPPLLVLRGEDPCQSPDGVLRYMNENLQRMLPASWQDAFQQTRQRGVFESLCMLYVAMTRARRALYMASRPTKSGPRQEFDSLLQSILAQPDDIGRAEAVLFERGNACWFEQVNDARATTAESQTVAPTIKPMRIALRTDCKSAPPRSLRVAAPSTLGKAFEPLPLADAFSYSQTVGATFGTLIHAFFEKIKWLDKYQPDPVELRKIALATITPEELRHVKLDQVIASFQEMLELRSVKVALNSLRYTRSFHGVVPDQVEVDNERVINLVVENRLISGTIDRLVVMMKDGLPYAAEIIDFKTDAYDPNMTLLWVQDRIDHHRPQLEVYAHVVSQLFSIPLERIGTHLLLLSADEFVSCATRSPTIRQPTRRPHLLGDRASV